MVQPWGFHLHILLLRGFLAEVNASDTFSPVMELGQLFVADEVSISYKIFKKP